MQQVLVQVRAQQVRQQQVQAQQVRLVRGLVREQVLQHVGPQSRHRNRQLP